MGGVPFSRCQKDESQRLPSVGQAWRTAKQTGETTRIDGDGGDERRRANSPGEKKNHFFQTLHHKVSALFTRKSVFPSLRLQLSPEKGDK